VIEKLLDAGAVVGEEATDGCYTHLECAVKINNKALLELLLTKGKGTYDPARDLSSPLLLAIANTPNFGFGGEGGGGGGGEVGGMVSCLLDAGGEALLIPDECIVAVVEQKRPSALELLLKHNNGKNVNVNAKRASDNLSAISLAAKDSNNDACFRLLEQAGAEYVPFSFSSSSSSGGGGDVDVDVSGGGADGVGVGVGFGGSTSSFSFFAPSSTTSPSTNLPSSTFSFPTFTDGTQKFVFSPPPASSSSSSSSRSSSSSSSSSSRSHSGRSRSHHR